LFSDLYEYDLERDGETRLTHGQRAYNASVSPDGSKLVFVVNKDGTTNLATMAVDGGDITLLTSFDGGEQVYHPQWSPSGDRIIFDYSIKDGRDIATVRPDGSEFTFLVQGTDDSRCAAFTPDGLRALFSSDRTGIFNVYAMDLESGDINQLTNVLGGAFYPAMNAQGDLLYSLYTSGGYKLYSISEPESSPGVDMHYIPTAHMVPTGGSDALAMVSGTEVREQFDWDALNSYDDTSPSKSESRPYSNIFGGISVVPFLRIDNYNPTSTGIELLKPGVYLFSNEILEKTGFFSGAAINTRLERDLFFQFFYRGQIPLLYQIGLEPVASLEVYNVTRKTEGRAAIGAAVVPLESTLDLLEFNIALNQRALSQFTEAELRYRHSRYTSILNSFTLP
ncbi:MAG: PD40 domain-containing protein, partial [Bacteroidetes bacterium]|nr:PD40 domain-containing protein [Bacteroidota bacterium]